LAEIRQIWSDRFKGRHRVFYNDNGERKIIYNLPPTSSPDRDSVLAFSLPKAGSVLLEKCLAELSAHAGLVYVSIMVHFFKLGLQDHNAPRSTSNIFAKKGYCYGGFRSFPTRFSIPILRSSKKILLVRDPRDMVTSNYFSNRESHKPLGTALNVPTKNSEASQMAKSMDIDAYVEKISPSYKVAIDQYKKPLRKYNIRLYRYEDVIYDKTSWLKDICSFYEWDVPDELIAEIAGKNDLVPTSEETSQHVRQVHPGDFRRKLKPETIDRLTNYFAADMRLFGYSEAMISGSEAGGNGGALSASKPGLAGVGDLRLSAPAQEGATDRSAR
jgi:hypothetical protein